MSRKSRKTKAELQEAPEALGQLFTRAIREGNRALFNEIFRRPFIWGKYFEQLTPKEKGWVIKNTDTYLNRE